MRYRKLGKTDLEVSEISRGCWTLGGRNWKEEISIGWADPEEREVIEAVRWAVDHGVNHFDNADVYGDGRAERMLARALDGIDVEVEPRAHEVAPLERVVGGHLGATGTCRDDPAHAKERPLGRHQPRDGHASAQGARG